MTNLGEVGVRSENTASKPDRIPLHHILEHIARHGIVSASLRVVESHAVVKDLLDLTLQARIKSVEEGRATRQYHILVQLDPVLDRATLNGVVQNFAKGLLEVFVDELGVEEHFGAQKALVTHI